MPLRRLAAAVVAALAMGLAVTLAGGAAVGANGAPPPFVHLAALRGRGEVALVRGGVLYLAGGAAHGALAVAGPGSASYPQWSHDGRWVAYTRTSPSPNAITSLWVVRANGADNHRVPIGSATALYVNATQGISRVWSPRADLLATYATTPDGEAGGVWVASAAGQVFSVRTRQGRLERTAGPIDLVPGGQKPVWAPTGTSLAYAVTLPSASPPLRSDALYTRSLAGRPVRHIVARQAGILPVAFWPKGDGLLYWVDPQHSASLAADGLNLSTIDLASDKTQYLATTLTYRSFVSFGPRDMVAIVAGGPRTAWTGKVVMQCMAHIPAQPTEACVTISPPGGPLTLEPAWSSVSGLAYVQAKDMGTHDFDLTQAQFKAWSSTWTLWIMPPGKTARKVASAGTGVWAPVWSQSGRDLMLFKGANLYVLDPATGRMSEVAAGIGPSLAPMGYYGYLDEAQVFAWLQAAD